MVDRVCRKKERVAKLRLDARVLGLPDGDEQRKLASPTPPDYGESP